jgi:CubicO group peptidase (beta-lactamase class C family)
MASALSEENPLVQDHPFEWPLGHVTTLPMIKLKNNPGDAFHYSNSGAAHLVLLFRKATGERICFHS